MLYEKHCRNCTNEVSTLVIMERSLTFCSVLCCDQFFGTDYLRALESIVRICGKARTGSVAYMASVVAQNALDRGAYVKY